MPPMGNYGEIGHKLASLFCALSLLGCWEKPCTHMHAIVKMLGGGKGVWKIEILKKWHGHFFPTSYLVAPKTYSKNPTGLQTTAIWQGCCTHFEFLIPFIFIIFVFIILILILSLLSTPISSSVLPWSHICQTRQSPQERLCSSHDPAVVVADAWVDRGRDRNSYELGSEMSGFQLEKWGTLSTQMVIQSGNMVI